MNYLNPDINLTPDLGSGSKLDTFCAKCGAITPHTAEVAIVLIRCSALEDPEPFIPSGGYRLCMASGCTSVFKFMAKCIDAAPKLRYGGVPVKCFMVFKDFTGAQLTPDTPNPVLA